MPNSIRIEEDLSDTREVPANAYHGVYTLRAIKNFYIGNNKISDIPEFVHGMVVVRKAAAMANKELQTIPRSVANVIIAARDEVLNNGKCIDQSPVDVYQSSAGTSANMDTSEVLASIGLELTSHQKDEYRYLNPNDHINKYQSTSDVYPTGFRIAVYSSLIKLVNAVNQLREGFECKAIEFQDVLKVDRIQLQDIVPTAFGQEFRAFNVSLKEEVKNIQRTAELLLGVDPGVTAIGTGPNTPKEYSPLTAKKSAEVTSFPHVLAESLIEATSDYGTYVMVHGALKRLAVKMFKIRNDLRLFPPGPRVGLNETNLSGLQTGSSIISAKVNPVVPEMVNQVCFKIVDNDTTVTMAAEASQLQLNVMEPAIGQVMFGSVHILTNTRYDLLEKYANGITADKEVCEGYVYNSIGVVTYLNPFISHHSDDAVSKICAETGKDVREVVLGRGLSTETELGDTLSTRNLMHPAYKVKRYTDKSGQ